MTNLKKNTFFGAFVAFGSVVAANDDWTVTLIQEQLDGSGQHSSDVSPNGSGMSMAPIGEAGAEFTLWATRWVDGTFEETLIDTELVGAYEPNGSVTITTPDPYEGPIPRTRIDKGFTVETTVSGLIVNDPAVPASAKSVLLDHDVASSTEILDLLGLRSFLPDLPIDFAQQNLTSNTTYTFDFDTANIPGNDVYSDAGMEYFRLYSLADETSARAFLGEAAVEIWPMAKAEFIGISEDEKFRSIPEVKVELSSLYPESRTWVEVHRGPKVTKDKGQMILEAAFVWSSDIPADTTITFRELGSYIEDTGNWTLEVLTETPFGIERLATRTIKFEDKLKIRGSLQTLGD